MAFLEAWIISSIVAIWAHVREDCSYAFLSGRVPVIVVLIPILSWIIDITPWLMLWKHKDFGRLRYEIRHLPIIALLFAEDIVLDMIEFANRWWKKSKRGLNPDRSYIVLPYRILNNDDYNMVSEWLILKGDNKSMPLFGSLVQPATASYPAVFFSQSNQPASRTVPASRTEAMCSRKKDKSVWLIALSNIVVVIDFILINHNKLMWLIALANMMVLIHVIYNHQLNFHFYGTNDGVRRRLGHRVAPKSIMGAAAAKLANNKGVEILAAAIDSTMTGGVATSAIHSLRLVLDSGATRHVVGDKSILQGYRELADPKTGILPDGSTVSMTGVGTIQTEHFTITDVRFVENLSVNLISVSQLERQYGMGAWFLRGRCGVMLDDGTDAGGGVLEDDGLYVLRNLHVPAGPVQEY